MIQIFLHDELTNMNSLNGMKTSIPDNIIGLANEDKLSKRFRMLLTRGDNELGIYANYSYTNRKSLVYNRVLDVTIKITQTPRKIGVDTDGKLILELDNSKEPELIKELSYTISYSDGIEEEIVKAEAIAYIVFKKICEEIFD